MTAPTVAPGEGIAHDSDLGPGLYRLEDAVYHKRPELSAGNCKTLIHETAAHLRHALDSGEEWTRAQKQNMDRGSVIHDLLLGQQQRFKVVSGFSDWRTKAAKAARDQIEDAGKMALLEKEIEPIKAMLAPVRRQILASPVGLIYQACLDQNLTEVTVIAEDPDDGTPLRCKPDAGPLVDVNGCAWVLDLKTTTASANPLVWARTAMRGQHIEIQSAHYIRCVAAALGVRQVRFIFVAIETAAPHMISLHEFTQLSHEHACEQLAYARDLWNRCHETGEWPGYAPGIEPIEITPWMAGDWQARKESGHNDVTLDAAAKKLQMEWQAPVGETDE